MADVPQSRPGHCHSRRQKRHGTPKTLLRRRSGRKPSDDVLVLTRHMCYGEPPILAYRCPSSRHREQRTSKCMSTSRAGNPVCTCRAV
ncbi:hypothetical protein COCC4DRAFT_141740 [Bipolaris maydis ATCC 48331]|uniref:Uncharacterized protein n=2 Tax=Cochliobolus heterostrophus TaxID=5016 RepID=M2TYK9_COCH5|nr:uncharacterized protein COCC4DRAFT_141740 [Bipolaris maydis ATCC 48331]EMD86911.1 hypothetical protein COCHEDRAFT_1197804 [Bipolaris maydis C5]ENI04093.1 hypothetical protein COCC4DRAFT_141740 [Bipolaris maydis ATCC 48331]